MTIQLTISIVKLIYRNVEYIQMTIQLNIYIVKWLDNCVYSNDYTIDYIQSSTELKFKWLYNCIHIQMTKIV